MTALSPAAVVVAQSPLPDFTLSTFLAAVRSASPASYFAWEDRDSDDRTALWALVWDIEAAEHRAWRRNDTALVVRLNRLTQWLLHYLDPNGNQH